MVDVLFSFVCVLISIRCLGCSFKEIFGTLKDFLLYYTYFGIILTFMFWHVGSFLEYCIELECLTSFKRAYNTNEAAFANNLLSAKDSNLKN